VLLARIVGFTVGFAIGVFVTEALFANNQSWPDLLPFALALAGAAAGPRVARRLARFRRPVGTDPGSRASPPRRLLMSLLVGIACLIAFFVLVVMLDRAQLLAQITSGASDGMAPTIPACNARWMAEGFTYHFRDPHRGEIVAIHTRRGPQNQLIPDPSARSIALTSRVIGIPGDTIVGRAGRVYVNGKTADEIPTSPFQSSHLGRDQYFVLGDNRSSVQDSRDFGPVPRKAIFARVILIYWPLGRLGGPGYDKHLQPPGPVCG
jgi:signal peptidase I